MSRRSDVWIGRWMDFDGFDRSDWLQSQGGGIRNAESHKMGDIQQEIHPGYSTGYQQFNQGAHYTSKTSKTAVVSIQLRLTTTMAGSWNSYYNRLTSEEDKTFAKTSEALKDLGQATAETIGGDKIGEVIDAFDKKEVPLAVLLPARSKTIKTLHSCFLVDGKVWGFLGVRGVATLQELPVAKLREGVYLGNKEVPSLEKMAACNDAAAFKDLEGEEVEEQAGRQRSSRNPPMFLITTAVLAKYITQDEIQADELAFVLMQEANDEEKGLEDLKDILSFLWLVASGACGAISLPNPTKRPEAVDARGEALLRSLYAPTPPQEEAKGGDEEEDKEEDMSAFERLLRGNEKQPKPKKRAAEDPRKDRFLPKCRNKGTKRRHPYRYGWFNLGTQLVKVIN